MLDFFQEDKNLNSFLQFASPVLLLIQTQLKPSIRKFKDYDCGTLRKFKDYACGTIIECQVKVLENTIRGK